MNTASEAIDHDRHCRLGAAIGIGVADAVSVLPLA